MTPNNITLEKITERLVETFADEKQEKAYYNGAAMYHLSARSGSFEPQTRPAYVAAYGADVVAAAEKAARATLDAYRREYAASAWATYRAQADAHRAAGQPVPDVDTFAWATSSRRWDSINDEIWEQAILPGDYVEEVLVRVDNVCRVSADDFDRLTLVDELCAAGDVPRGSWSGSDAHIQLVAAHRLLLLAVAVVTDGARYYYIGAQNGGYTRYIALPDDWRTMYAPILQDVTDRDAAQRKADDEERERARAKDAARYEARCAKWTPLMRPIAQLEAAVERAPLGSAERRAANRKLMAARRDNILAMCRAAFPGVKFTLRAHNGWGPSWELAYFDGPTEEVFHKVTDLELFTTYNDRRDAADTPDTARIPEDFCAFARTYMGDDRSGCTRAIWVKRRMSNAAAAHVRARLLAERPELAGDEYLEAVVRSAFSTTIFALPSPDYAAEG